MKSSLILLSTLLNFSLLFAENSGAQSLPPAFKTEDGKKIIFADFKSAEYRVSYDIPRKKAVVKSQIELDSFQEGFIAFDLVTDPKEIALDGEEIKSQVISTLDEVTKLRIVSKSTFPGRHILTITHDLTENLEFENLGVKNAFWVRDRFDRQLLERYLPTNLEFDQYPMTFYITFEGGEVEQAIFSNGRITKLTSDGSQWKIDYRSSSRSSSIYFHTGPKEQYEVRESEFISPSSRLPITIYSRRQSNAPIESYLTKTEEALRELDENFGVFPYNQLIIYAEPQLLEPMNYAGVVASNEASLSHHIAHNYFGQSIYSKNGNSRWINESIVSWRDQSYPKAEPTFKSESLDAASVYRRTALPSAYDRGADIISFFDFLLSGLSGEKKSFKQFLTGHLNEKSFMPWSSVEFQSELEAFYGKPLKDQFDRLVFGGGVNNFKQNIFSGSLIDRNAESPHHPLKVKEKLSKFL